MSTTQRSESINAFFMGTLIQAQVCNNLCTSIERQFQSQYTHAKLNEVQAEFIGKMNCVVNNAYIEGDACRFTVIEEPFRNGQPEHRNVVVLFHRQHLDVCCTCLLFEFRRILCRHYLIVLAQEKVTKVPTKYVLVR